MIERFSALQRIKDVSGPIAGKSSSGHSQKYLLHVQHPDRVMTQNQAASIYDQSFSKNYDISLRERQDASNRLGLEAPKENNNRKMVLQKPNSSRYYQDLHTTTSDLRLDGLDENQEGYMNRIQKGYTLGERASIKKTMAYQAHHPISEADAKSHLYSAKNKETLFDQLGVPEKGVKIVKFVTKERSDGDLDLYLLPDNPELYHANVRGPLAENAGRLVLKNRQVAMLKAQSDGFQRDGAAAKSTARRLQAQIPELFTAKFNLEKHATGYS